MEKGKHVASTDDKEMNVGVSTMNKVSAIFVLGPPGSGKSTQSRLIAEQFGLFHISAGDILRAEVESGSEDSIMIKAKIANGELVPSDFMIRLLLRDIQKSGKNKFVIDGFPRSMDNLNALSSTSIETEFVLHLVCSKEVAIERLSNRNEGRDDDNIKTIVKRFECFESVFPVLECYDSKGKLYKIDAEKSKEGVMQDIKSAFTMHPRLCS
ncbi:hypothetical protein IFM89_032664 [Coptis chinensis]|uniref:adenylate kinase n=1 Tax=Coptis chinensis TaxID=261450 RepID=A0A835IGP7_9MAGN|nr:hypothetical protein IFM89_032664 [Coptis chinensis]